MLEAINHVDNIRLVIEYDDAVGYYLYVFPIGDDKSIADHLCDTLDEAFIEAKERYRVSKNKFVEV